MTNSFVSSMFRRVSFDVPSGFLQIPMAICGGSCDTMLKYENGATFLMPFALNVEVSAIGRGTTPDMHREYADLISFGLKVW